MSAVEIREKAPTGIAAAPRCEHACGCGGGCGANCACRKADREHRAADAHTADTRHDGGQAL